MKIKSVVFFSLLAATVSAQAESGFYVLGSIGQSRFDYSNDSPRDIEAYLDEAGYDDVSVSQSQDKSDTGYKLQVGYQINDYFAVEGGYVDLGKYTFKGGASGEVSGIDIDGRFRGEAKASGFTLNGLVMLPLNSSWSLFAKVGVFNVKVKQSVSVSVTGEQEGESETQGAKDSHSSTKVEGVYGVGVNFNVNKNISVRAEVERYNQLGDEGADKANVDLFSVGAAYRF